MKVPTTKTRKVRTFLAEMAIEDVAFRGRIRQTREERGMTREQLADLMEISSSLLEKWENGRVGVPEKHVGNLARALEVDKYWLRYGDGAINPERGAAIEGELAKILDVLMEMRQYVVPQASLQARDE